jgi:cell division protein FtsZ
VLLSIAGGSDLGLFEINEAASLVQEAAHPEANIIFGTVIDDSLGDEVRVTVIAAGFDSGTVPHAKAVPSAIGQSSRGQAPGRGSIAPGDSGPRHSQPPSQPQPVIPAAVAQAPTTPATPVPKPEELEASRQGAAGTEKEPAAAEKAEKPAKKAEEDDVDVPSFMR